jgi:replicative DNA helicase
MQTSSKFTKQNAQATAIHNLKLPPYSLEAEQAVLGSIMIRPDAYAEIADIITEENFYSEKHKKIFKGTLELLEKGNPVDYLSLKNTLDNMGYLDQIGGASYLAELVQMVPSSSNIEYYARILEKKFMMRHLINAAERIGSLGYAEQGDLEEIMDTAEKEIFSITNKKSKTTITSMKEGLIEAWDSIDKIHNSGDELRGVPTGFPDLDNKLSGLQKSDLIILAARPSCGKTSLALDIAKNAAVHHGVPVLIFSLEMSSQQLLYRMISSHSRVDSWKLRTGKLNLNNSEEYERLQNGISELSNAPIYIDDQAGTNIVKMRSTARKIKSERKLGLIVVDYLQLMSATQSRNSDNVVQQISEISKSLKHLARELDVPVLALSQLSRAVEQRQGKPRLSDLRDSGSIEQDADIVMFIHREDKYKDHSERDNIAEILIEKHRNGPTGAIKLKFDDKHSSFLSLEKGDYSDFDHE